jgi:hypothetical protein
MVQLSGLFENQIGNRMAKNYSKTGHKLCLVSEWSLKLKEFFYVDLAICLPLLIMVTTHIHIVDRFFDGLFWKCGPGQLVKGEVETCVFLDLHTPLTARLNSLKNGFKR